LVYVFSSCYKKNLFKYLGLHGNNDAWLWGAIKFVVGGTSYEINQVAPVLF
jgi:hypothetical protein